MAYVLVKNLSGWDFSVGEESFSAPYLSVFDTDPANSTLMAGYSDFAGEGGMSSLTNFGSIFPSSPPAAASYGEPDSSAIKMLMALP